MNSTASSTPSDTGRTVQVKPGGTVMIHGRKSLSTMAASICAAILYPVFLIVSTLFVIPISLVHKALAGRADLERGRRAGMIHRTRWFVFVDVIATVATYVIADIIRCEFHEGTTWPEVVPGYGPTLWIHLTMLGGLIFAWPTILYWQGWYRARARSWKWRVRNTGAAAFVLALFMSAAALVAFREIYPRMQIGMTVVLLPLITGAVRFLMEGAERISRRNRGTRSALDLV